MKRDNLRKFETPEKPKGDSKLKQAMNKYDELVAELKAYKANGLRNGKKLAYEEAIKRINYFLRNEK